MTREYIRPREMTKTRKKYIGDMNFKISKSKRINSIKELIAKKQYSKALTEIEDYLEKYPNDSYGLFQRGCLYDEIGEKQLAKEDFQYIIDNKLESIHSSMFKLAMMEYEGGNYKKAVKLLIENIETSNYPEIYSIIGLTDIYLQRGEKQKALDTLCKYGDMNNDEIIIQYVIVLNSLQQRDSAYEILVSHNYSKENYAKYYWSKASIEANIDMPEQTLKTLEEGEPYFTNKDRTDYIKAVALYRLNRYEEAIDTLNLIVTRTSSEFAEKAYYMLGEIYNSQQKYEEAIKSHLMTIEYQSIPVYRGYYNAAKTYTLMGDYDKGKEYYFKCIGNSINKKIVASSYLGICFLEYRKGNIESLRNYISKINADILEVSDVSGYSFLKSYLDRIDGIIHKCPTYTYQQTYDYNLERLVNHIDKDHGYFGKAARFNDEIDLNELVLSIPELLDRSTLVRNYDFDYYLLRYDDIGFIGERKVDYLEMVVIPNTKNVLTMYPTNSVIQEKNDKEYEQIDKKIGRQKQKSMIEKFNQRYGKKSEN